jgi:uncharacterized protein YecT (DUF1311 family)
MCVTRADVDRAALESCKGVVTRACIEAEGGSNSMTDVLCRGAETDAWEALMNQAITRITLADAVDGDLVAAASQAWTPWREAECNYRAYEYGGGSGEQVDRAICYLDLTAARAIDLIAR